MTAIGYRMQETENYLHKNGFINIDESYVQIWEMYITIFVKKSLRPEINQIKRDYIKQGKLGMFDCGNKGGVAYSFYLRNRVFNFFGLHLKHGQENADVRDVKMAELLRDIKLQPKIYKELESDSVADYCYVMGDMNYRLNSTYTKLNKDLEQTRNVELDQLHQSFKKGNYPCYQEPHKNFLHTYKLDKKKPHTYVNKKDQAHSYCDRVLCRPNTCDTLAVKSYEAFHEVLGSDHRPVCLHQNLTLKNLKFLDLSKEGSIGILQVKMIAFKDLKLDMMV